MTRDEITRADLQRRLDAIRDALDGLSNQDVIDMLISLIGGDFVAKLETKRQRAIAWEMILNRVVGIAQGTENVLAAEKLVTAASDVVEKAKAQA